MACHPGKKNTGIELHPAHHFKQWSASSSCRSAQAKTCASLNVSAGHSRRVHLRVSDAGGSRRSYRNGRASAVAEGTPFPKGPQSRQWGGFLAGTCHPAHVLASCLEGLLVITDSLPGCGFAAVAAHEPLAFESSKDLWHLATREISLGKIPNNARAHARASALSLSFLKIFYYAAAKKGLCIKNIACEHSSISV